MISSFLIAFRKRIGVSGGGLRQFLGRAKTAGGWCNQGELRRRDLQKPTTLHLLTRWSSMRTLSGVSLGGVLMRKAGAGFQSAPVSLWFFTCVTARQFSRAPPNRIHDQKL